MRFRRRYLSKDASGYRVWKLREEERAVAPSALGIILCDIWDMHWCRGANERLERLLPRMAGVVDAAREKGTTIIHAPSGTLDFYKGSPARERVRSIPRIEPAAASGPGDSSQGDPPLPIDASDGGPDTDDNPGGVNQKLWTRQHAAIHIDQERDCISDDGGEIYSFLRHRGITTVIIMGVHTNMCILNRSFAIKRMVRWGQGIALCRDLTDAMYNPAMPPYVSHDEGTRLVVEYVEKHWCPTVLSEDLT